MASDVPVIAAALRTPFGEVHGALSQCHPAELLAAVLVALSAQTTIDARLVDQLIVGCAMPVGAQSDVATVCIGPQDDMEQRRKDIAKAIKQVDSGNGAVILTDLFGGTPSNLAISVMGRPKVEVLAGINLPMLVKLAKVRDECPLTEAVAAAQDSGRKYITIASRVLTGK
jgi:PTS system mannose-specific IIA component